MGTSRKSKKTKNSNTSNWPNEWIVVMKCSYEHKSVKDLAKQRLSIENKKTNDERVELPIE